MMAENHNDLSGGAASDDRHRPTYRGADAFMAGKIAEQLTPMFSGEIWEWCPEVPMGKGYANEGQPFDIESAQYLKPVFRAIKNPAKRMVVIKAGVQTLKTWTLEKSTGYFATEDPGDMTFYDCDQEAALDHAKSRVGPLIKSIPGLAAQFAEVESGNRHDITTTEFYLPGMTLRFWPLNLSSTQRITLRYVFISDAFLSKNTGMIKQAKERTTQHPLDKKILIESQGSDEGDDFDQEFTSTDQGMLWVKCPLCAAAQEFVWDVERADGTFAGFKRSLPAATPELPIKTPEGEYNAQEILRQTHYECLHCRGIWLDTPEVRAALDASSFYVPANPNANPEYAGFSWPKWINRRLAWGELMLGYLTAKRIHTVFGNVDPLKQWYQKVAGRTWSDKLVKKKISILARSQGDAVDNLAALVMSVDCQQGDVAHKTGKFWVEVRGVTADKKMIAQPWRGYCDSWQEWWDVQDRFKIENENVAVDGGNYLDEILDAAASRHRWVWREILNPDGSRSGKHKKVSSVWKILRGNGLRNSFAWSEREHRAFSKPIWYQRRIPYEKGQVAIIKIPLYEWSNLSVKDHFYRLLQGSAGGAGAGGGDAATGNLMPVFQFLRHDQLDPKTQEKERGDLAYEKQLQNQYRGRERNKDKWIETSPNVHYADTGCQCLVLFDMGGFLGLPAVSEATDG